MKINTATVSSKGQVVLPKDVREHLGVKQGDEIEFVLDEHGVHVRPKIKEANPFLAWIGAAPVEGAERGWLEEARHAGLDDADLDLLRAGPGAKVVRLSDSETSVDEAAS